MKTADELQRRTLKNLKPVRKMTVSEWAEKYFRLPSTSAEPGRYKTSRTPYVREIMDAFTQADVHKIVVKSAAQAGKSTILLAVIGRFAHLDPAAIMIVQPTLEMAQDFSKDRLERMIQDVGVLTPLFKDLTKSRNANQTILSKFYTGGRIVLQGANSPAGLASRPIRILLCDEVDRFPASAGTEGDPISLAEKRQTSFWNYKTGLFSTPTVENASRIDVEYNLGTCEKWKHKCPNCGEYHFLDYREMAVNYDERIDEYKKRVVVVNQVKWRCPDCGEEFSELEMKNSTQKYVAENVEALKNGVRSFWVNGFSSTFLSWNRIMQEYLEARGDAVREAVVFNTRFGLSYEHKGEFNDENTFLNRLEDNLAEVPDEVKILTAGVDVQNNRFEVTVFGWGVGESAYGICHEVIRGSTEDAKTFEALDNFLAREWHYSNGTALKLARVFIDSGYNTKMIYEYCRRRVDRGIFPIKGTGLIGVPLLYKYHYPKGAGVILTILGVNDGKNIFFGKLAIESAGNSGYVHFLKDNEKLRRGFDEGYFRQLIAERRVIRRSGGLTNLTWEPVKLKARNEALDCAIYAMAAFQSCKGNLDSDEFFKRLTAPAVKKTMRQRNIEVW